MMINEIMRGNIRRRERLREEIIDSHDCGS